MVTHGLRAAVMLCQCDERLHAAIPASARGDMSELTLIEKSVPELGVESRVEAGKELVVRA